MTELGSASLDHCRIQLDRLGIWNIQSQNRPAQSCADAAGKRNRLGHTGIPLSDELKTHLAKFVRLGRTLYVAVHCRGHQIRDDAAIDALMGSVCERVDVGEVEAEFGLQYGMINPLSFIGDHRVVQVFDAGVLQRYFPPYTMMTNLGSLIDAFEFEPHELVHAVPGRIVADVTADPRTNPRKHVIGILTGNSPESGMELWAQMNDAIRQSDTVVCRGDTDFPRVLIESLPEMGMSMELSDRYESVRSVVRGGIEHLCQRGATVIAIACNTTQHYSDEARSICELHGAEFISLVDETRSELLRRGIRQFDLLGIGPVADFNGLSDFARLQTEFEIFLPSHNQVKAITALAFEVKKVGGGDPSVINKLRDIVNRGIRSSTILVALTELSLIMKTQKRKSRSGVDYIDTVDVLAKRLAEVYLTERSAVIAPTDG